MSTISIAASLPNQWSEIRFRYVASTSKGRLPVKKDDDDVTGEVLPYLSMEYLRGDSDASHYVPSQGMVTAEDQDVMLLWDGSNAGEFLHAKRGAVSSTAALVSPLQFDRKFLFWLCKAVEPVLKTFTNGMGIPHVDGEFLKNLVLPYPTNSADQVWIANYLDRETARIDALVAEKEKMLALLEKKRAELISCAVTRGLNPDALLKPSSLDWLGDIPAHWDVCQLKRTWASSDYGLSDSIRDEGDISVLRMSCIVDGRIDTSKAGTIEEADSSLFLRRDDLLFNRTNSLDQIAKVGLIDFEPDFPLTFASYLVRIRANHLADSEFLVYLLNSSKFLDYARKNAIPAIGQANLSPTRYGEIKIPLPGLEEQKQIVCFLNKKVTSLWPLIKEIKGSIELLIECRASLITAAVTGQISEEKMRG